MNSSTSVRVNLEFVRNLGNYESIRISIGVEDTVRQGETVNEATDRIYEFVETKLIEKSNEVESELKGHKK
jgi:hypothetical protein